MEQTLQIDRKKIVDKAKQESDLSDLKQHADKMIRGFENFDSFSSNRAIWELIQNACDLTKECEVLIDYSKVGISFTHNGKPFTTNSLISLIKQVSGKYGEESDIPEVGKYGTGFLTTHTFGRKFYINSFLKDNDTYFEIKDFLIDRSPKEWKELRDNIKIQKDNVYQLIEEGTIVSEPDRKTTFTYVPETEQEYKYIDQSSKDLEDYIPIVLTINDRLKKVTIVDQVGSETIFIRTDKQYVDNENEINLHKTVISKNGQNKAIFSIIDSAEEIEVILPINENFELYEFSERIARLFLYYPLVGSESFGLNFIVNCNKFLPTEQRDGIHLMSNKDQVKAQEESNRNIIKKASQLIFAFLSSNVLDVPNPLLYAKINFKRNSDNSLLNEYFEELQTTWTDEFKLLPIVKIKNGYKPVSEVTFFHQDLVCSADIFDELYELAAIFFENIPIKDEITQWSKFVNDWVNSEIIFINHKDILTNISNESLPTFENSTLIKYYRYLIENGKNSFFSELSLLPNIDGKFCILTALQTPKYITPKLVDLGRILIPKSIERLIHEDFYFDFKFTDFTRKDFSISVKAKLDEMEAPKLICLPKNINLEFYNNTFEKNNNLDFDYFIALLTYCKLNNNITSQSKPSNLVKIISKYYEENDELIYLPSVEDQEGNLDIRSSRKVLVKIFFNIIEYHCADWVKNNISLLLAIANCNEDSLKDIYSDAKIYPNQVNRLKYINELKRDIDARDEIKDLYDRVTKDQIRTHIGYREFSVFIAEDRYITNESLAASVESVFFENDIKHINEHPFKEEIIQIISKLKIGYYASLFPRLDPMKASIMLDIVTNDTIKDDIFSIVTLKEEQLKSLGRLIQEDNFQEILNMASAILQNDAEKKSDFKYKYEIGTNIEKLIREKLSTDLSSRISIYNNENFDASNIQGGQDIILLIDENPIYYIEVKSRWNPKSSVLMSKLQLQRSVEETHRYALCSVDLSQYSGSKDRYKLSIEEILPYTKFIINIGDLIKPLIEGNLKAEQSPDISICLTDYQGLVPQNIVREGKSFDEFVNEVLIGILEEAARKFYA